MSSIPGQHFLEFKIGHYATLYNVTNKRNRKDTEKDHNDTEKDHNDTEKDTCTYLIPERRLYRFVSE